MAPRRLKSTSYAVNMAAEAEARARGADDAVFVSDERIVLEGPVTNVWWRRGRDALHAVARPRHPGGRDPSGCWRQRPYGVSEGAFPLDDLLAADEVFTSSSVREVMPVVSVDGHAFERGPAAAALQAALREAAGA